MRRSTGYQSAFISAGQRCTCSRRILVKQGPKATPLSRVWSVAGELRVGRWDAEPQPFMGGVVSATAAENMLKAQQHLLALGGKSLLTMRLLEPGSSLLSPGIVDLTGVAGVPDEEYFGPLTTIVRYRDFDEALQLANRTRYGLSVGLVSPQRELFERLLLEARAGIVNWNKPLTGRPARRRSVAWAPPATIAQAPSMRRTIALADGVAGKRKPVAAGDALAGLVVPLIVYGGAPSPYAIPGDKHVRI